MSLTTDKNYLVHYYEIDIKKRALLTSIINYLMDVCTVQSDKVGVSLDYMMNNNKGWILIQWDIKIHRYPTYDEIVKVSTTSHSFYKYYSYRKHSIVDKDGNILVEGTSIWLLVDTVKRKPLKLDQELYDAFNMSPEENERFPLAKLPHLNTWDTELTFKIRYSDIDTNHHVNNVKYINWIVESIPLDIALNYELKNLTIVYKKETSYGHNIHVHTKIEKTDTGYICHHNIISDLGEDLTLAKTYWE